MKRHRPILYALGALLFAALLVPFFLGARAAHPATDDFTFALYTHPTWVQTGSILRVLKDALSYALRTWRDWQGTVTGVILMALNPAVFSLPHYGVHAVVLLALILVSALVFLRHMLGVRLGLPRGVWLPMAMALAAVQLVFLPDFVEGIYWFNGAWSTWALSPSRCSRSCCATIWPSAGRRAQGARWRRSPAARCSLRWAWTTTSPR